MHIRRATLADTAEIATVASNAMLDDEFLGWLHPYRYEHFGSYRASFLHRTKKRVWAGNAMLVMVTDLDDSDWDGVERIISYMAMKRSQGVRPPLSFWDAFNLQLAWLEDLYGYYLRMDKSANYRNLDAFFESSSSPGPLAGSEQNWEIDHLSVDNNFQRRGIGQQMIKKAQTLATEDKLPLILIASVKGAGLYTKCGFKRVGLAQCRGFTAPAMVWTPETTC
jgi:ribosomal protein S18 acetylase RimI-like enzyme